MSDGVNIFSFAGSLRKNSYNKSLLRTAVEIVPAGAEIEVFDLAGIPPFNTEIIAFNGEARMAARHNPPGLL